MTDLQWVLDTNIISKALRGDVVVRQKLSAHHRDSMTVTAITIAELSFGTRRSSEPVKNRARWSLFLRGMVRLAFDEAAAEHHADIRDQLRHQPIGERDLLIAAIARAHSLAVVTNNTGEFARVPGLRLADWTLRR
jgi:tRNA(fMet)-specific endonuclease VapC